MRFDLPAPDRDTQPFWDACRAHRLLVQQCGACEHVFHYPRPFCPRCWSPRVAWIEASGRGTLYTYSVIHRHDLPPFSDRVPFVAAMVDLDEGPRLTTNLVDCDVDTIDIGMRVAVDFRPISDDVTIPVFRPASTVA
jgi:hypothetical protein